MAYERKVKVVLHGYLKNLYTGPCEFTGYSVAEVITGLCRAAKSLTPKPGEERMLLQVMGFNSEEDLHGPIPPGTKEIHLMPAMVGGKKGGFFQIIIGTVLIAAAFALNPGLGLAALASESLVFSIGVSLVLGGLLQLMSPQPKMDSFGNNAADPEASKYLGPTGNTVRIGTRIPVAYGKVKAFGHYLSFDVDAKDVAL